MTTISPPNYHPARYSAELISAFAVELFDCPHAHDPFAGTGERLGSLCDEMGVTFSGTELEGVFIRDPRVWPGDSRDPWTYPRCRDIEPYWVVTSPVYANGMADNFKPSGVCSKCKGTGRERWGHWYEFGEMIREGCPRDEGGEPYYPCKPCDSTGKREHDYKTYRVAKMRATGDPDAELTEGNMGAHSYRGGRKARERYWAIAHAVIAQWTDAERVLVNVSDFYLGPERVPHVLEWVTALETHGWTIERTVGMATKRMRKGANGNRRVKTEAILVATMRGRHAIDA